MKKLGLIAFETFKGWKGDRCGYLGAGIAFFALLSLGSFVLLFVLLTGRIEGSTHLHQQVLPFLRQWLDPRWVELVRYLVTEVKKLGASDVVFTVSGALVAAFGAGGFANQMRGAIRLIWGKKIEDVSVEEFLIERVCAVAVPLLLAGWAVLGVYLRISTRNLLGIGFGEKLQFWSATLEFCGTSFYWGVLVAILYKTLAPVKLLWKEVLSGAFLTSLIMTAARVFTNRYLSSHEGGNLTGVAGDLMAFLLLSYFYAQVFLAGAELTAVLSRMRRKKSLGKDVNWSEQAA